MRILVNIDELGPRHGVAVQVLQVSRELARRGYEVDVAYILPGEFEAEYRGFAHRVVQVPRMSFGRSLRRAGDLPRSILAGARLRPDVVYDNVLWSLPWSTGVAALSRAGLVGHMHGFHESEPATVQRHLMLRVAKHFVACSSFARDQMLDVGIRADRITVAMNGVAPADYPAGGLPERASARSALGLRPDSYVLAFLGRINPDKGLAPLLEAVRQSANKDEIEVLIFGRALDDDYLASVKRLGEGIACHWHAAAADVLTPYYAADLVVVPSLWKEPFGRVAVEALATGRPVVASRSGGLAEIFTGEFERFLVEPGDAAGLAQAIDSLRDWRTSEPELAARCTEHVCRNFNIATMIDKVEEQLNLAARGRRSS
jgi:glycosyltransferase involved in cell wall biosynthesis